MNHLDRIKRVLEYIDGHLDEALRLEQVSALFHFSPYYFHRMFTAVVGRPITAYMRERRLQKACGLLKETRQSVLSVGMDCGFDTAQAFCRAFKNQFGLSPTQYRANGASAQLTAQEMVDAFRHKLKGGVFVEPRIIRQPDIYIAGVSGDGSQTAAVWQQFMALNEVKPPVNALSQDGYEVRIYKEDGQSCHVGLIISEPKADSEYTLLELPAAVYAAFDVYVAEGYDSRNSAINDWLAAHSSQYAQHQLEGKYYIVEYYDERFHGDTSDSIVEIWVPLEER